jgi:OFA family oxalate/formate antiporter-like MFS transporter
LPKATLFAEGLAIALALEGRAYRIRTLLRVSGAHVNVARGAVALAVVVYAVLYGAVNSLNMLLTALVVVLIMIVNAGYGGGFSNVPTLLSDHYGMSNISAIHGITLSAWAFAGLTGNNLASLIVGKFGAENVAEGYQAVLYVTIALYIVSLVLSFVFVRPMKKDK